MQTVEKKFRSMGCDVKAQVPATVEDFNKNAWKAEVGTGNPCLDEAINNVVYRGVLADFRDAFCERVGEVTSIARRVAKTIKNAKGEAVDVYESEGEYISFVRAQKGWTEDNSVLQGIADEVAATLVFDASATERKAPGPKKLPKSYTEAATRIFTNGTQDKWATKFGLTFSGDKDKDIAALGWKIKADVDAKQAALVAEMA